MNGISGELNRNLREVLLSSHYFDTNTHIRNLFLDERLISWKDSIPSENNPSQRVDSLINFLYDRFHNIYGNALLNLVIVIQERLPEGDAIAIQLNQLLHQLSSAIGERPLVLGLSSEERPYHNLRQPTYSRFIGREEQLEWIRKRLAKSSSACLIAVTGIGGVGKSSLVQAIAHEYWHNYHDLDEKNRFEAIIWNSAKEEVLKAYGREPATLSSKILRTLEDVYTTIAQTLKREDITRAQPEEQSILVEKALNRMRTLLIIDNLESVQDSRIHPFLRSLPVQTKVLITSREWIDLPDVLPLSGLSWSESNSLIAEAECVNRNETPKLIN